MAVNRRTRGAVVRALAGLVGLSVVAGVLITATMAPTLVVVSSAAAQSADLFEHLPSELDVERPMEPTTIYATSPDGAPVVLARFFDQNRIPVTLDQISPVLRDAVLASEDSGFYEHSGVDLVGTAKAVLENLRGESTRGGSTITQQYVKNVLLQKCERDVGLADDDRDAKLEQCWLDAAGADGSKGIERKIQEIKYAVQIEKTASKNDILAGYLNFVNFGGTTYGIEAAAQRYFGATAATLTLTQAATLAGMVQNPNAYRIDLPEGSIYNEEADSWSNSAADGYAATLTRRNYVLERMLDDGRITAEQYEAAHAEPIVPAIVTPSSGCVDAGDTAYFCQYVKATLASDSVFGATQEERDERLLRGGMDVYTSLSLPIQEAGAAAIAEVVPPALDGISVGAAGVTLESGTGRILAMVQNTLFSEDSGADAAAGYSSLVYAADSAHGASQGFPVGSAYKIFTLIDWLEKGRSLNERLDGVNRLFDGITCDGAHVPFGTELVGNAGGVRGYTGTPLEFTAGSLNSGYFAMAEKLDLCDINRVAERFGVRLGTGGSVTEENAPFDILGSKNIAPLDMASAIGAIGNGGIRCTPRAIDTIVEPDGSELTLPPARCDRVVSEEVAATAAYALERVMTDGTGTASNPGDGVPVIGKTGSHNDDQTTMLTASTRTATAVWVGQSVGQQDLADFGWNGTALPDARHELARGLQAAANEIHGGDAFPEPSSALTRRALASVPSVVGMTLDQAESTLSSAGFDVLVGETVLSDLPPGVVVEQDPAPMKAEVGSVVRIRASTGTGVRIPDLVGQTPRRALKSLQERGFHAAILGTCVSGAGGSEGAVTATAPSSGAIVMSDVTVLVDYEKSTCP